jgi:signal transduction histidine kinase
VRVDRGRAAQALGNLLANAAEHGSGSVSLRARASGAALEIEIRNRASGAPGATSADRGRGLRIARDAARSAGGDLRAGREGEHFAAVLRLPLADRDDDPPAAA